MINAADYGFPQKDVVYLSLHVKKIVNLEINGKEPRR